MTIVLIRHPEPDIAKGVCYGQLDVPLPTNWQDGCQKLLNDKVFQKSPLTVIASPLSRCRFLAQIIAKKYNLNVLLDDRLKELNFGDWEGQAWDDIADPMLQVWMNDYLNVTTPNGESWQDLKSRLESFLQDNLNTPGTNVLITHAGVIRTIKHLLTNEPIDELFAQSIPYLTPLVIHRGHAI